MKYTEFKEIANNAGYITSERSGLCIAEAVGRNNKIIIDKCKVEAVYIDNNICNSEDFEVIKAAVALAETPLEEREEEKKYYLRHRFLEITACSYLNRDRELQELNLNDKAQFNDMQTQFTQAEIDEIKEKYNTDLKDFEIIEVKE